MALPPAPAGWTRLVVKSKFGSGRDFAVSDPGTEEQLYVVDGKFGVQPKAEIRAGGTDPVYRVKGSLLGFPKHMTITDATGADVASLRAKTFSPIKTKMTLEMMSGEPWILEGSFIEKNYTIRSSERPIVEISQKWITMRDRYTLDVVDGVDPGLALAVLWAVDRWVERD
jgi:uncharacterized protein YxjI